MALAEDICVLVDYACDCDLIGSEDRVWAYNSVLEAVGATGPAPAEAWLADDRYPVLPVGVAQYGSDDPDAAQPSEGAACSLPSAPFDLEGTLARLSEEAVANGAAEDTASGRDRAAMRVMGLLTPRPSEVALAFDDALAGQGPRVATSWFYDLCCNVGYVRRAAIARNIAWETPTRWGGLEITINRSKPEKDPRDIARAGAATNTGEKYPACQLCVENEGYPGRSAQAAGGAHPARQNLRIVPIELGGERWGLQYSPYAYFNEHCIAMSVHHRHMHVDRKAVSCLLDFVDLLPQYFIGSNADLPVVGGSILSHDHFQGGAHEFAMMRAAVSETFALEAFPGVSAAVLEWPMSVLRLRSDSRVASHQEGEHRPHRGHGPRHPTAASRGRAGRRARAPAHGRARRARVRPALGAARSVGARGGGPPSRAHGRERRIHDPRRGGPRLRPRPRGRGRVQVGRNGACRPAQVRGVAVGRGAEATRSTRPAWVPGAAGMALPGAHAPARLCFARIYVQVG